jgi:hypothetical protein
VNVALQTDESPFMRVMTRYVSGTVLTDDTALVAEFIAIGADHLRGQNTSRRFQNLFARIEARLDQEQPSMPVPSASQFLPPKQRTVRTMQPVRPSIVDRLEK